MPDRPIRRRCYLHVGPPKTGTSFLQSVFWRNREALATQGLGMLPHRRVDHLFLALKLRGLLRDYDDPRANTVLERLRADVGAVSTDRVLLTQEAMAPTTPDEAAPLLEMLSGFEVHVVVTVRDLARQLPSVWQQSVKTRHTYPYDAYLRAVVAREPMADEFWGNQDLGQVLEHWRAGVPADRIHVVTTPADDPVSTLLERFCSVVGIDPNGLDTGSARANPSLGHPQAELLRRVNLALGDRFPSPREGYTRLGRSYLANRILQIQTGQPIRVPASMVEWCEATAEAWVTQIRKGGYHLVGDESDLRPEPAWFAPAQVSEPDNENLLGVAAAALADVLEVRDDELNERNRLRRTTRRQASRIATLERELASRPLTRIARAVRRGRGAGAR